MRQAFQNKIADYEKQGKSVFTWMKAALPMICRVDMAMPHGVNAVSVNIIGRQRGEPM